MKLLRHYIVLAFTLTALVGLGAAASAETSDVQLNPVRGFIMTAPNIEAEGASIHGSVCRNDWSSRRPRFVRIERLSGEGIVVDSRTLPLRGTLSYRGGCGFYAARNLADGQSTRISALMGR
jgi:hypothetical protein